MSICELIRGATIESQCDPIQKNIDLNETVNLDSLYLSPDAPALPCGILPKFFPTDRFVSISTNDSVTSYGISNRGILPRRARYNFSNYNNEGYRLENSTEVSYSKGNSTKSSIVKLDNWTDLSSDLFSSWMVF